MFMTCIIVSSRCKHVCQWMYSHLTYCLTHTIPPPRPPHSDTQEECGAGEATVFDGKLYLDNNSGTYKPNQAMIDFSVQALTTQLGSGAGAAAGAGGVSDKVRALDCFNPANFPEYCRVFAGARGGVGGPETPHARDVAKCSELHGSARKVQTRNKSPYALALDRSLLINAD